MDFLKSIAIAASGLRAQAGRMRVISENIANADSTAPAPGGNPYRRKIPTFRSEIDRALDVNLRAPMMLARAAGPAMTARGGGHIVFISSMGAKAVGPALGVYSATKAGLRALALALRQDLRASGVGVSVILPGPIGDAGMWADTGIPTPRGAGKPRTADDVARAVIDAIEHNRFEIEVASFAVRIGGALAQVRPTWFVALGRRNGANDIAVQMTDAARNKR